MRDTLNWRSRSFALLLARRSNWIAKHGRSLALERQIANSQSRVFPALAGHPCNFHPGVFASTVLGYALATPPGAAPRFARVTATPCLLEDLNIRTHAIVETSLFPNFRKSENLQSVRLMTAVNFPITPRKRRMQSRSHQCWLDLVTFTNTQLSAGVQSCSAKPL